MSQALLPAGRFRLLLGVALVLVGGCGLRWDPTTAPDGFGIIREHVLLSPRDLSGLDFTILEVDGRSPSRERIPFWVDMVPGVQVAAGSHRILARVIPHARRPGLEPREMSFEVTVQSGKAYNLVDDGQGRPVLVECRPVSR